MTCARFERQDGMSTRQIHWVSVTPTLTIDRPACRLETPHRTIRIPSPTLLQGVGWPPHHVLANATPSISGAPMGLDRRRPPHGPAAVLRGADESPANLATYASLAAVDVQTGLLLADASNLATGQGTPVALGPGNALAIRWPEAREVHEIRLQLQRPMPGADFRVETGSREERPAPQARAPRTANPAWDPWDAIPFNATFDNRVLVLRLRPPDTSTAASNAAPSSVRTSRRVASSTLVLVERFAAFGSARLRRAQLAVDWDPDTSVPGEWSPRFEARNGRILSSSKQGRKGALVDLEFLWTPMSFGSDRGQLLFRSGETRSFALFVEDALQPGGARIAGLNVHLRDARASASFPVPVVVMNESPKAQATSTATHAPVALGVPGLRQNFHVWPDGSIQLLAFDSTAAKVDREARPWKWPDLRYQFGFGEHPRMGPTTERTAAPSLEDDWLPILIHACSEPPVEVVQTTLASTLMGDPSDLQTTTGSEPVVLVRRLELRNRGPQSHASTLWIELNRAYPMFVSTDGSVVLSTPSDGRARTNLVPIRAHVNTHGKGSLDLAVLTPSAPGSYDPDLANSATARQAVRFRITLEPGSSHAIDVAVPGAELLSLEQITALKRLDFARAHHETSRYWKEQLEAGMDLAVPDASANRLFRTSLWRALNAIELDPATGSSRIATEFTPSQRDAGLDPVLQMLQTRGEFRASRTLLEPAFLESINNPTTPILQRARLIRNACRQFELGRDAAWLRRFADAMILASDRAAQEWINAKRAEPEATPRSSVSSDSRSHAVALYDAQRHLADALKGIAHPDAARLERAATTLRVELAADVARSVATAPALRLADNRFVPCILPLKADQTLDAKLDATAALFNAGVFPPDHPFATWLALGHSSAIFESAPFTALNGGDALPWRAGAEFARFLAICEESHAASSLVLRTLHRESRDGSMLASSNPPGNDTTPGLSIADQCERVSEVCGLLFLEREAQLLLAPAIPAAWLKQGDKIEVKRAATRFGSLDLGIESRAAENIILVSASLAPTAIPASVTLRLRHPDGRAVSTALVNGQLARIDPVRSTLSLPLDVHRWEIIAKF